MNDDPRIDPPPLLGTWGRLYLAVILWLVILIAGFDAFTRAWNR